MNITRTTTNGYQFIISEQDVEFVDSKSWFAQGRPGFMYVATTIKENGKYKIKYLHRLLFNLSDRKVFIDHINHNTLDNTRQNLRLSDKRLNQVNKYKKSNCSSKYIGVTKTKSNTWQVQIRNDKIRIRLGCFKTEEAAALAYNEASLKINGDHATLNVLSKSPEEIKQIEEKLSKKRSSNFKGVCKVGKKWGARIFLDNKRKWIGVFETEEEAAQAIKNLRR
jgi:hypothetical protein